MPSAETLRTKARLLLREAEGFIDPEVKQELAARAFELAQRAARIDVLLTDPGRIKAEIVRCRSMLMDASLSPARRRLFGEALADAEGLMTKKGASFRGPHLATSCWAIGFPVLQFLT